MAWTARTSKWQVRFPYIAVIASFTLILHGFFSLQQPVHECSLQRNTEVQYRFIQQTLSPEFEDHTVFKYQERGPIVNPFISPYHKLYPVNCTTLFLGSPPERDVIHSKLVYQRDVVNNGSFPVPTDHEVIEWLWNCEEYSHYRRYPNKPMSVEEEEFPIAYIIVAHKDAAQIERLLRAIYQPQNIYCIHPDLKSAANFKHALAKLASCFPNVVIPPKLESIQWGNFSRLMADIHCMKELLKHEIQWKYLLNLCGQDFPLKTNIELVRLMKSYNGKNYIEGGKVGPGLYDNFAWRTRFKFFSNSSDGYKPPQNSGYPKRPVPSNITIYKGDNYMAATREFIDFIVNNPKAIAFLQWCNDTYLPEETYPNSLHRFIGAPGGETTEMTTSNVRFRKWADSLKNPSCRGKYVRQLCIFECNYLEHLYDVPHLFVNKFHYDYDPVTMQCMEELLYYRSRIAKT